jgi:hypothetical protein
LKGVGGVSINSNEGRKEKRIAPAKRKERKKKEKAQHPSIIGQAPEVPAVCPFILLNIGRCNYSQNKCFANCVFVISFLSV